MALASRFESPDMAVNTKLDKSNALLTWRGQDLFADFVAQVTQQVLRTLAASFRLVPGPVQQPPELGQPHALRRECQRGAAGAVGVDHSPHGPQWIPITQFSIVGHGWPDMCGGQQVLPERGKTAAATGADLWEKAFQVFAHDPHDFSFGHRGRRYSPG